MGILLWILISMEKYFFTVSLKLQGLTYYILHYLFLALFVIFCCAIYYKKRDRLSGAVLGLLLILTANILNLLVTVQMFIPFKEFYSDIYLWAGFLEIIIVAEIYSLGKKR